MIEPGLYRHFKGGIYEVLLTATCSETKNQLVIYRSCSDRIVWARPLEMWNDTIDRDGYSGPRFVKLS